PGARARRAAPRGAGDHRRAAHRGRLDRCDRDDRRVPAARRARLSDLPRAEGTDALQDGDLLGRRARGRARAKRRCMPRRAAPARGAVDDGEGRLMLADAANLHTFVEAFRFIGDNPSFLLTKTLQQLELAGAALGIAALVALPIGVGLGHLHRGSGVAIGSSIIGRGLPSLVLIAAFLTVLGIGFVNNMVALAVLGSGPILTNAYNAVEGVDRDTVEAARGMGMTRRQILTRVELPLAVPLLFTGIRVAAVTIVATAPIAAIAGGGGLGDIIVNQASYRLAGVLGASFCVMLLSAAVFLVLVGLQATVTPRGLRSTSVIGDLSRKEQQ